MSLARECFDILCRARDALDVAPDGPERDEVSRVYLKTRIECFRRCQDVRPILNPVPIMNARYYVARNPWGMANFSANKEGYYGVGQGRGWARVRHLPVPDLQCGPGVSARRVQDILHNVTFRGTPIISRKLLDIWQRFDPSAIDALPISLSRRNKKKVDGEYFFADIVRLIPAFNMERMDIFLFRNPRPNSERSEYFPTPNVFALGDGITGGGVHLFRDQHWGNDFFISIELHAACLAAGIHDLSVAKPEAPDVEIVK